LRPSAVIVPWLWRGGWVWQPRVAGACAVRVRFLCVWGAFVAWGGVVPLFGCRGPLALRQGDWVMVAAWGWGDGVGAGAASGAGGLLRGLVG